MQIEWLIFPLLGAIAGVLAGLLGVGGGLVLIGALVLLLPAMGIPTTDVMHAALASSLAAIVLTGLSSSRSHAKRGSVLWPTIAWLIPGMMIGGWLGSGLAVNLSGDILKWVVAIYCLGMAIQMWVSSHRQRDVPTPARSDEVVPQGPLMLVFGTFIGALSALVGIGGGSMTVPLLIQKGVSPVRAVGSSAACGVAIGLSSAIGYALHAPQGALPEHASGYIYWPAAIGIAIGSVSMAPLGVRLAHALSGFHLQRVFAGLLLAVGLAVIFGQ